MAILDAWRTSAGSLSDRWTLPKFDSHMAYRTKAAQVSVCGCCGKGSMNWIITGELVAFVLIVAVTIVRTIIADIREMR